MYTRILVAVGDSTWRMFQRCWSPIRWTVQTHPDW